MANFKIELYVQLLQDVSRVLIICTRRLGIIERSRLVIFNVINLS